MGNAGTDGRLAGHNYGNGPEALGDAAYLNGQDNTAGGRAKAVMRVLIKNGIDPGRIKYGTGTKYDSQKGRKTTFEIKNP